MARGTIEVIMNFIELVKAVRCMSKRQTSDEGAFSRMTILAPVVAGTAELADVGVDMAILT